MSDVEDDNWTREFHVSNPQKTHAGYTVYRISSKVYPNGFPEGASEIIVFKRYSEFRKLYKELKVIYENKNNQTKLFPHFSKAHFFSRFDESVLELRQKQALMLLNFAGNISFLFTSKPFVQFFEGGVEHMSHSSSRGSSDSDQPYNNGEMTNENDTVYWSPQTYFPGDVENVEAKSSDDERIEEMDKPVLLLELQNNDPLGDASAPMDNSKKKWLARAISLCSEGDDIEALAAEAGCNDNVLSKQSEDKNEASGISEGSVRRSSQPSQVSLDLLPTLLESSEEDEDVFDVIIPSKSIEGRDSCTDIPEHITAVEKDVDDNDVNWKDPIIDVDEDAAVDFESTEQPDTIATQDQQKVPGQKVHGQVGRLVSNIGFSWIDPNKKDYLYEAAQMIQQALYSEANEMYEDAFNKYKICVGILLKGVQHDSNSKRREAVRRKTAQYLVKAEFLFNTYLRSNDDSSNSDSTIKAPDVYTNLALQSIVDQPYHQLTLRSLKVIGIIKRIMLVQCVGLDGVFVVKVLHKTNAVHRSAKQESKEASSKGFSKKYIKSPYMVKLHRHFDTSNNIFLLLEYASGGSLWNYVNNSRQHVVDSNEASGEKLNDAATKEKEIDGHPTDVRTTPDGLNLTRCEVNSTRDGVNSAHSCVNSTRDGVGEEIEKPNCEISDMVFINKPGNSSPDILTSSIDLEQTTTSLLIKNSDKEIKTEISEGKYITSENKANTTDIGGNLCSTDSSSVDKRCLNQGTSSEWRDHDTDCSHEILSCLDHVTKSNLVTEECVQCWIAELLLAVASIHSCGIILKDLKPCNVLLDGNNRVVLSYFGAWEEVDHSVDPEAVEHFYCAPEISYGEKITIAADWWSLGVLSYELITGKSLSSSHPWGIHSHSSINFPLENISPEARSFLKGLICHNASERLGSGMNAIEEIKSHVFFKGINWDELSTRS